MDIDGDYTEPIAKPTPVKVAGWLLVLPAAFACGPGLATMRFSIAFGLVAVVLTAVTLYGLVAVNLNLPGAQIAGGWGALALGCIGPGIAWLSSGTGLLYTAVCLPIAYLLLIPTSSRRWFAR